MEIKPYTSISVPVVPIDKDKFLINNEYKYKKRVTFVFYCTHIKYYEMVAYFADYGTGLMGRYVDERLFQLNYIIDFNDRINDQIYAATLEEIKNSEYGYYDEYVDLDQLIKK